MDNCSHVLSFIIPACQIGFGDRQSEGADNPLPVTFGRGNDNMRPKERIWSVYVPK